MKLILLLAAALTASAGAAAAADKPVWPVTCLCKSPDRTFLAATVVVTKDNLAVLDALVRKTRFDAGQKIVVKAGACPQQKLCGNPYTKPKARALYKPITGTYTIHLTYTWSNPYPKQVEVGGEFGMGGPIVK